MTNRKNNKRALFISALSMLLCVTMLVGTTFAWFTDTDTTAVSNIVSGTLDVEIVDEAGTTNLETLDFVNAGGSKDILWEPGASFKTQNFKLKNDGNLWLKCKVEVNNTDVSYNKLNEVITFKLVKASDKSDVTVADLHLGPKTTSDAYCIIGTMDTNAGNEYQSLSMDGVSITVYATQYTSEVDMTDNQYDKEAAYPTAVATAEELYEAINNGETAVLTNDITLNGGDKEVLGTANTKFINIDGNGHTITFANASNAYPATILKTANPDAVLSISNAKITRTYNPICHYHHFLNFRCNTNLTNVELDQGITLSGPDANGYTYNFSGLTIDDARTGDDHYAMFIVGGQTVNMSGCEISVAGSGDRAIKIVDEDASCKAAANLSVSDTTFRSGKKAAILVGSQYGANITLSNVDITAVSADSTNAVWVDSDYAAYADKVVVTGGTKIVEN